MKCDGFVLGVFFLLSFICSVITHSSNKMYSAAIGITFWRVICLILRFYPFFFAERTKRLQNQTNEGKRGREEGGGGVWKESK